MHLTLYVPGLFGPEAAFSDELVPRVPCLEALLGRADRKEVPRRGYHHALADLFGLDAEDGVPVAALMRHAGEASVDGYWMRADPVHLAADQSGLVVAGTGSVPLDEDEAEALAAELAPLFAEVGATLHRDGPRDWYLHLPWPPALRTFEPDAVSGRNLLELLPRGPDAARWHRLLNEVQMCMHASAVNRRREEQGQPLINSLWFWGGGMLPAATPRRWSCVAGEGAFLQGLARLAATPHRPLPDGPTALAATGAGDAVLAVPDRLIGPAMRGDLDGWSKGVLDLERHWFAACLGLLRRGTLHRLSIVTDRFDFSLSRIAALRFWRRPLPLATFVAGAR